MAPVIYEKEFKETLPTLEDGGKTIIRCSNCQKPLMTVHHTRPHEKLQGQDLVWYIQAQCCYCEDRSYILPVKGGFHHSGYDIPHPNKNPEDVVPVVDVVDIKMIEYQGKDVSLFITEKK